MRSELLELMRPHQWYKNAVVFLALFFSANLFHAGMLTTTILAFISLCLVSSASYAINDILDVRADRAHDKKRNRPIASGRLSLLSAGIWALLLYAVGLVLAWWIGLAFFLAVLLLVALMQSYNLYFKNIAFADLSVLSVNFMVRAIAGALAIHVVFSSWLILGTYVLALFLSTGKRIGDLQRLGQEAPAYKAVFKVYTRELLDRFFLLLVAILFMTYALYSFLGSPIHPLISMASVPVVFFLILRYYSMHLQRPEILRDPERALFDRGMLAGLVLLGIILTLGFYFRSWIPA